MKQKFIMMGLLMVLCTADPEKIKLEDANNERMTPIKFSPELQIGRIFDGTIDDVICSKEKPVYCVEEETKNSFCVVDKYFTSLKSSTDTEKEVLISYYKVIDGKDVEKLSKCQLAKNILDLDNDAISLMLGMEHFGPQNDPYDKEGVSQCLLIGHQYKENTPEKTVYFKMRSGKKVPKHRTGFQTFGRVGQMHYDFLSCSTTNEGIVEAKEWYENYKKTSNQKLIEMPEETENAEVWYKKCKNALVQTVQEWYKKYKNTWKFWIVIIILIVVLFGGFSLCVYYYCVNQQAESVKEDIEGIVDNLSNYSSSKSDFVIDISDLHSIQNTQLNTPSEHSAETLNSVISITDPKSSHSTGGLSFLSDVELTEEVHDSKDSNHSLSETKVEETEDKHLSLSETEIEDTEDTHHSQSETEAFESEEKHHSNSESDFSI